MPRHAQRITLIPFVEDLLASVQPWFRHPEVRRRLGGPDWPARELRLLARDVGERIADERCCAFTRGLQSMKPEYR